MSNIGIALQFEVPTACDTAQLQANARLARENGFDYLLWHAETLAPETLQAVEKHSGVKAIALQAKSATPELMASCRALQIPDLILSGIATAPVDTALRLSLLMSSEAEATAPQALAVCACVDVGGALRQGEDGPALVRAFPGRAPLVLLNDPSEAGFAPLGQGALDWPEVFDAGEEAGTEWYVAGSASVDFARPETLRACYDFLVENA